MTLRVTGADLRDGVTWYTIQVERGDQSTVIERRFSVILSQLHEPVGRLYNLNPPSKRALASPLFSQTKSFVAARINELQAYFNLLLSQPGIDRNDKFLVFFQLDQLGEELQGNQTTNKRQTVCLVELLDEVPKQKSKPSLSVSSSVGKS
eukprot:TRINITY_DN13582_c0_g1_i1.p1 TRINITY_DN13582_c0_g1~~TRINITY_DN13582_c0_g1_i1.p1  ORF type:complete len:164 (+),score=34.77 TRINITY_DN13582_c0_g1_i1:44-493(+)